MLKYKSSIIFVNAMNYSKPATLLARKCLLSPSEPELEAIISLDLPINWFEEGCKSMTLIETCFKVIHDKTLFDKFWKAFSKETGFDVWSFLPESKKSFVSIALLTERPDVFKVFLISNPGTKDDWSNFGADPNVLSWVLSPTFSSDFLKFTLPDDIVQAFLTYRNENLWINSKNERKLKNFNVAWDGEKEKRWLINSFKGDLAAKHNQKTDFWRLATILRGDRHFEKWSEKDWSDVWLAQPTGLLLSTWNEERVFSHDKLAFDRFVRHYKPKDDLGVAVKILERELGSIVATVDKYPKNPGVCASVVKALTPWVSTTLSDPNLTSQAIYFQLFLDYMASPTKFDTSTMSALATVSPPSSLLELHQKVRNSFVMGPYNNMASGFLSYCVMASIKAHKNNLPSGFLGDFVEFQKKNNEDRVSTPLVGYAERMATKSQDPAEQKFAAEIFWRAIFDIPPANQHYWLKKASVTPCLSGALPFWNDDFSERLNRAAEKRKRTKEISTLLSRLAMNNAIAQVLDPEARQTPQKPRKM